MQRGSYRRESITREHPARAVYGLARACGAMAICCQVSERDDTAESAMLNAIAATWKPSLERLRAKDSRRISA